MSLVVEIASDFNRIAVKIRSDHGRNLATGDDVEHGRVNGNVLYIPNYCASSARTMIVTGTSSTTLVPIGFRPESDRSSVDRIKVELRLDYGWQHCDRWWAQFGQIMIGI